MTGLQWAVLTAYARTLPRDSEARQLLEAKTKEGQPTPAGARVGRMVAEASGLLKRGQITPEGVQAARAFFPYLTAKAAKKKT